MSFASALPCICVSDLLNTPCCCIDFTSGLPYLWIIIIPLNPCYAMLLNCCTLISSILNFQFWSSWICDIRAHVCFWTHCPQMQEATFWPLDDLTLRSSRHQIMPHSDGHVLALFSSKFWPGFFSLLLCASFLIFFHVLSLFMFCC